MKKLTILLFSILIFIISYWLFDGFDKTICVETDTQDGNGLIYSPNKTELFSGTGLCEDNKGWITTKGKIKKGKWANQIKYFYYENGQIKFEENYKDGKEDGE
jgi:hypothetical protein